MAMSFSLSPRSKPFLYLSNEGAWRILSALGYRAEWDYNLKAGDLRKAFDAKPRTPAGLRDEFTVLRVITYTLPTNGRIYVR